MPLEVPERLRKIRTSKNLKIRPTRHLKTTFTGFDGEEHPLKIRYYQVQGILHLVAMARFVLGDDTGLGKTLEAIAALCYIWEKDPDRKVIVLTTKSATPQWAGEFAKFTTGVRVIVCQGTPKKREKARAAFLASKGPTVMVGGYRSFVRDITAIQEWEGYILVCDEATAFKNPKTQVHQVVRHMAFQASRAWGLTATLIKNNLMEGYGIYQVIKPDLFGMTANRFMMYYCLVEMISIPRSNRKVPKIVGYAPDKVREFRERIEPVYLGRPKHEVAADLPVLEMKQVQVGLSPAQQEKYDEALSGLLTMGSGVYDDATGDEIEEVRETDKLTQVTYCQEIVNHLDLINCEGSSEKLKALLELLTEGDLADENAIVFTRFSQMVDILMPEFAKAGVKAVRVTGEEKLDERQKAMWEFQTPTQETRVICITMAGGDAINLQAAKAIVFYDTPWSAGDFIQIVGRMIRIGSLHDRCYAIHLVARGRRRTVDARVLEVMHRKMKLVEAVLGKRLKGEGEANAIIPVENDISEIFSLLVEDAREGA